VSTSTRSTRPGALSPKAQRNRRRTRLALGILVGIAILLAVAIIAATSYVASVSNSVSENLQRSEELPAETPTDPAEAPRPAKSPAKNAAVNYVLMGSDSRSGDSSQGRSDVLMVLHLSVDRKSAALISFPRDLYVSIPGHGKNKINAAFAFGGTPLTVRTLEGLLGTRMDHVALINFEGFIALTEQLGGVTVNNPHASVSQGYNFPVGPVTVSGAQALAYVRERHQLPRGDLDRAERQRLVTQAVLKKGLSKQTLMHPVEFNSFVGGLAKQVTVDQDLSMAEMRKTALSVRVSPDDIESLQAPITGFGTSPSGQSIDVVDKSQMKELAAALKNDRMNDYIDKHPEG
jgi:LCP family protein required for cell wall assembly